MSLGSGVVAALDTDRPCEHRQRCAKSKHGVIAYGLVFQWTGGRILIALFYSFGELKLSEARITHKGLGRA